MQKIWILPLLLAGAACGPRDRCEAPAAPAKLAVADLTLVQKADALGVPPSRVPTQADSGAEAEYTAHVSRINESVEAEYCVENEAYKARNMKDEMGTVARAVSATCKVSREEPILATVLKYRNCAAGNK